MYKVTAEPYAQPLDDAEVVVGSFTMPDGTPAPTGYFPNVSGNVGHAVVQAPMLDALYAVNETIIPESLGAAESVDQHPFLHVAATWTPPADDPRPSGVSDPLAAGPPMPTLMDVSLWYQREQGSSNTSFMDVPGHKFPQLGSQDGASSTYFQDSALVQAPYNQSMLVGGEMPDTLRALPASPAHGWTEQPVMVSAQEEQLVKYESLPGQQPPHQDFLANSTIAGQSYGLTTAHVSNLGGGEVYSVRRRV